MGVEFYGEQDFVAIDRLTIAFGLLAGGRNAEAFRVVMNDPDPHRTLWWLLQAFVGSNVRLSRFYGVDVLDYVGMIQDWRARFVEAVSEGSESNDDDDGVV